MFLGFTLSSSSNYSDLMPQFLRAVRVLCHLYPLYRKGLQRSEITGVTPAPHSVPTSPAITSSSDFLDHSALSIQRAGSFGSLLESGSRVGHTRTQTVTGAANLVQLPKRRDHRRTHSQTLPAEDTAGWACQAECGRGGRGGPPSLEDPFSKLEAVWSSLESWFDLILTEVEKTAGEPSGSVEGGRDLLKRRMESVDRVSSTKTDEAADPVHSPETSRASESERDEGAAVVIDLPATGPASSREGGQRGRKKKVGPTLSFPQSNEVAAAIVKSTPVERRVAYLG